MKSIRCAKADCNPCDICSHDVQAASVREARLKVQAEMDHLTADRDELLSYVRRFVRTVDRGEFLKEIHWLAADGRALDRKPRDAERRVVPDRKGPDV